MRDLRGREWVVRPTFAPWWRVVRPLALFGGERRRREPVPPKPVPRKRRRREKEKADAESVITTILLLILSVPDLLLHLFLVVLAAPLVPLELLAIALSGCLLGVLRTVRLVRHRVDVLGVEDGQLRSLTVLLVRGSRHRTNALVQRIAATIAESKRAYDPGNLPKTVTVVSRKGFWH